MSVSRYRDRHAVSGAKSDPGDAKVLADLVRTGRHNHRPAAGDSDLAGAVKVLARAHQSMIWSRRQHANRLCSALREFYPAALAAFDDLTSGEAIEVLRAAPAPALGAALSRAKIAAGLRRGGRQRRTGARAGQIQAALRAPQLTAAPLIASAMGAPVSASVVVIAEVTTQIAALEQQLAADLSSTRTRRWSAPCQDWGPSPAPGCPASSAMRRTAIPTPSLAGTTPEHHPSPKPPAPAGSSWPATPATSTSPERSTFGRSPRSMPALVPARSTTPAAPPGTPGPARPRQPPRRHPARLPSCTAHGRW